jgi:fructose transport system ATP-binding protein
VTNTDSKQPVLEARGISKHYGAVMAVDAVDITINRGEVLAVVGDNGAGKSSLVSMLCGAARPDAGELLLKGEPVSFGSAHDARLAGLEIVYQDLALCPVLDVASNMYLGREPTYSIPLLSRWLSVIRRSEMVEEAERRIKELNVQVPSVSGHRVDMLSGGQRQGVAIARAAMWATEVLFMDEPTAALGVRQSEMVLNLARRLAANGLGVVIITHTLPYVMQYADRVVVLRKGRSVADRQVSETTPEELVALIVGFERTGKRNVEAAAGGERGHRE